jgi:hypothetical protein
LAVFFGLQLSQAQVVMFNDHAPGPGTGANVTTWSVQTNLGMALPLKDVNSGNAASITLRYAINSNNVSGAGVFFASQADNPAPGTPAYNIFNGFVDFKGDGNNSIRLKGATAAVTNILSGLDPAKTYTFRGTAVHGGPVGGSPQTDNTLRWTLFTLVGAASFTSAHTSNAVTTAEDPNLGLNQVAINTGVNTNVNEGDMAAWQSIRPINNTIMIVCTHYSNNVTVSPRGFKCNGSEGYSMTGFQLIEAGGDPNAIAIANPTNNASFVQGQNVPISVSAGPGISSVSFYDGPVLIGSDSMAPFSFVYSNISLGSHALKAVGTTSSGSVTSPQVNIQVNANQPPSISITNPVADAHFQAGNFALINVDATDPDDGLARVDFYVDGQLFYRETVSPYFVQYNDMPAGSHILQTVAVDNSGLARTSAPVSITVTNLPDASILIANRSQWKYLDTGVDQGSAWRIGSFNDSTWKSGMAELGFGDAVKDAGNGTPKPEQTVIAGGSSSSRFPTLYFRRRFNVSDPLAVTNLMVNLLRDDGGVVYINGEEVFRHNMPGTSIVPLGAMAFTNLAIAVPADDGSLYFSTNIANPEFLVTGVNTIAVEIHQNNATSSDISFDLMLLAQPIQTGGGVLSALIDANNASVVHIDWTGPGVLQQSSDLSSPGNWQDVTPAPAGNSYSVNTASSPQKYFRLR